DRADLGGADHRDQPVHGPGLRPPRPAHPGDGLTMAVASAESAGARARTNRRRETLRQLWTVPKLPVLILLLTLVVAVAGPTLAPYSPTAVNPRDGERPPAFMSGGTWKYPLGTDRLGRDVFSRLLVGTRVTLQVATVVIVIGAVVGVAIGSIAG